MTEAAALPLPVELQVGVWRLLDRRSLCTASLVCRSWHALSSDNRLWREMCRRELAEVMEWTPRMLARRHKSWKRHFGVRLRAVEPIRAALHRVVPQLLDDAHARLSSGASRRAPTETVQITVQLDDNIQRERRFTLGAVVPHAIRHATSTKEKMVIMVPTNTPELVAEAAELGVACIDTDGIKAFNRSRKTMKKWVRRHSCLFAHAQMIRMIPRLMGPAQLGKVGKFPIMLRDDVPLAAVIETQRRTVKGLLRRQPCFDFAVGNVGLSAQQLLDNVNVVMDELMAQLPSREVIKAVHLHATQGPAFVVFSAPRPPARVSAANDEEETNE